MIKNIVNNMASQYLLIGRINELHNKLIDNPDIRPENKNILELELYKKKYELEKEKNKEINSTYYSLVNYFYEDILKYKIYRNTQDRVMTHDDIYEGIIDLI